MTKTLPRSLFVRVMCLLLCAVLLACFFMIPRAQAFAAETAAIYGIKELIAAILVAGGIIFASSDDARAAAGAVFDHLDGQASTALVTLAGIVASIGAAGTAALSAGVLISASLWDALADAFASLVSADGLVANGSGSFTFTFSSFSDPSFVSWLEQWSTGEKILQMGVTQFSVPNRLPFSVVYGDDGSISYMVGDTVARSFSAGHCQRNSYIAGVFAFDLYYAEQAFPVPDYFFRASFVLLTAEGTGASYSLFTDKSIRSVDYQTSSIVIPYEGDLVWPGEDTLVKAPDLPDVQTDEDTDQPIIAYPDLSLNPADHVADVPIDATGDKVDVPTDTLVDVGTGEIVDTDVNPDVDVPDTPSGTLPKPGDLTIPQLIITKFPFCIPFDLYYMLSVLDADPIEPVFNIPFNIPGASYNFRLDFSLVSSLISVVRWGEYICFLAGLALITRNVIKW